MVNLGARQSFGNCLGEGARWRSVAHETDVDFESRFNFQA